MFGSLSFAFGTASVVPAIQRQHSDPRRMPFILLSSLSAITVLYGLIGLLSYYQFGCASPLNLLQDIPEGIWKKFSYALMLFHILIAYAVTVHPALFVIERWILHEDADIGVAPVSTRSSLPYEPVVYESSATNLLASDIPQTKAMPVDTDTKRVLIRVGIRSSVVLIQGVVAILLSHSLSDLLNLIGATCVTVSCLVAPCFFQLKLFGRMQTQTFLSSTLVCCAGTILGLYSTYTAIQSITRDEYTFGYFAHSNTSSAASLDKYPYCRPGERN